MRPRTSGWERFLWKIFLTDGWSLQPTLFSSFHSPSPLFLSLLSFSLLKLLGKEDPNLKNIQVSSLFSSLMLKFNLTLFLSFPSILISEGETIHNLFLPTHSTWLQIWFLLFLSCLLTISLFSLSSLLTSLYLSILIKNVGVICSWNQTGKNSCCSSHFFILERSQIKTLGRKSG